MERSQYALAAIMDYGEYIGNVGEPLETTIIDLLADIRHLCDVEELNFEELDSTAYMHYDAERS